jgi:hypothetical protein
MESEKVGWAGTTVSRQLELKIFQIENGLNRITDPEAKKRLHARLDDLRKEASSTAATPSINHDGAVPYPSLQAQDSQLRRADSLQRLVIQQEELEEISKGWEVERQRSRNRTVKQDGTTTVTRTIRTKN